MKLKDLILILSPRITYDVLDFQAEKSIKWDNIDSNFYRNYGEKEDRPYCCSYRTRF